MQRLQHSTTSTIFCGGKSFYNWATRSLVTTDLIETSPVMAPLRRMKEAYRMLFLPGGWYNRRPGQQSPRCWALYSARSWHRWTWQSHRLWTPFLGSSPPQGEQRALASQTRAYSSAYHQARSSQSGNHSSGKVKKVKSVIKWELKQLRITSEYPHVQISRSKRYLC